EYPAYSFSRNGGPVIESIPAGIPLQGEGGPVTAADYSAGDKEAILRLYGAAPTEVTVTSNPVGLQVIVDGVTVTTPQVYNWGLYSQHTLNVPSGVQTLTGDIENSSTSATFYYTYGRWNDSTAQSHTITVLPGNGSPAFPSTSPQVATYSANFAQLVPYSAEVYPSGDGSVSVSPTPETIDDQEFFVARTLVTLTATPNLGWTFYRFNNSPFWLPGGLGANPKEFYVPDTGNPVDATAELTTSPVYTVNVNPSNPIQNSFSSDLWAYVDGSFWYTPVTFSPDLSYDGSAWNSGTTHTLSLSYSGDTTNPPEYPYSSNSRYAFTGWSDSGAYSHTTGLLPATSTTYTATVQPQFAPATDSSSACGGTLVLSPGSPTNDGFYPWGQQLTYTATANAGAGWSFAGWTFDLTGTTNPDSLTADDETLVNANFNTSGTPLTLTSLSPASIPAGSAGFVLTLTGAGFDSGSLVAVNGTYLSVTYVSSTELQVTVPGTLVASPANLSVYVEDYPSEWNGCAVFGYQTFTVTGAQATPLITWNPPSTMIYGASLVNVLNATANAPGSFSYTATPNGGSPSTITDSSTPATGTYSVTATFTPEDSYEYTSATMTETLTVSGESVWIVNGGGGVSELAGNGAAITSSADSGGTTAAAIDAAGNVWSIGSGTYLLEDISQTGAVQHSIASGGGLDGPSGIAIDGNSQVWVSNAGNSSFSLFLDDGTAESPSGGFTDSSLDSPSGIAVDGGGSVWIANKGNNSLTRVLGAAAPAAPLSTAA
ncbi:MAG: hypothetical protein WB974_04130, partial [Acidobacteriaceae bacterium]